MLLLLLFGFLIVGGLGANWLFKIWAGGGMNKL